MKSHSYRLICIPSVSSSQISTETDPTQALYVYIYCAGADVINQNEVTDLSSFMCQKYKVKFHVNGVTPSAMAPRAKYICTHSPNLTTALQIACLKLRAMQVIGASLSEPQT